MSNGFSHIQLNFVSDLSFFCCWPYVGFSWYSSDQWRYKNSWRC